MSLSITRTRGLSCALDLACDLLCPQAPNQSLSANNMSHIPSNSASSTSFETIFNAALEEYERKTKKNIASHPLAAQLKSCDSPSAILAVLRAQVQESDKSQSADERLTKWLDPTVNVLCAFSAVLGDAVGLVIIRFNTAQDLRSDVCVTGIPPFECGFCWDRNPLTSEHLS